MTTEQTAAAGPQTDMTADETVLSLTGFDEIAIATAFRADISALRESPFQFLRALIFVDQRRKGAKDAEAFQAAMNLTVADLNAYFPDARADGAEGKDSPSA